MSIWWQKKVMNFEILAHNTFKKPLGLKFHINVKTQLDLLYKVQNWDMLPWVFALILCDLYLQIRKNPLV